MANIYIYNYNNYYNRMAKPPQELIGYGTPIYTQTDVNFNPNDGVNTTLIVGKNDNQYNGVGDYLVVLDDGVLSRWFILDHHRRRKGQWIASLHRDVIADNYSAVLEAKCFIDRGTVGDNSPLIYNQEPVPVNQIKTSEKLLKDTTGCAWICGFLSRNYDGGELNMQISDFIADESINGIENWTYYKYVNEPGVKIRAKQPIFNFGAERNRIQGVAVFNYWQTINFNSATEINFASLKLETSYLKVLNGGTDGNPANGMSTQKWAKDMIELVNLYGNAYFNLAEPMSLFNYTALQGYQGKIIFDTATSKYWKVSIVSNSATYDVNIEKDGTGNLYDSCKSLIQNGGGIPDGIMSSYTETTTGIHFIYDVITVQLTEITTGDAKVSIPSFENRLHLKDAPYDMFCIPYGNVTIKNSQMNINTITIQPNRSIQIAQEIARLVGTSNIYDLQLLPYCPMTGFIIGENVIDINSNDKKRYTIVYDAIKDEGTSILLWSTASRGTLNIELPEQIESENKKLSNQCDLYRLVSPNYNGQFEFNLAKNGGFISYFNVDFTYLPYKSYVHVNPQFGGLYGKDFNDVRGLVCQGDFSIDYLSDSWANYQVNNKNYANIFARQIENLEVNHKYDRIENITNAASNALATGIGVAGVSGNAAIGIAAGMVSAAAGAADIALAENRFAEQLSYQTDIYNMQLENIRAMPYSIASQTAYSANNKIFPILEYYTCTEEEKNQVAMYIAENGMTVGVVGIIQQYAALWSYKDINGRGFIRATPIELNIADDNHIAQAIALELQKGVYFIS